MAGTAAYSADVYPSVSFAFNPATLEYAWTVNYTDAVNVTFATFMVYASVPANSWTSFSGAWSGSPQVDEGWTFTAPPNGDGTYALRWYAASNQVRTPDKGAWAGVFKITIPNSKPADSMVNTYGSRLQNLEQPSLAPTVVPEPSGMLALGSLMGLLPLALRRKR